MTGLVSSDRRDDVAPGAVLAPAGHLTLLPDESVLPAALAVEISPALLRNRAFSGETYLRIYRPAPTVAFTLRDRVTTGFPAAVAAARAGGFAPVLRAPGGRAVAYHEDALCVEIVCRSAKPREAIAARFAAFSDIFAAALRSLGVDARIGPVPGEYCPGKYSVNLAGQQKLIGTAQRITRDGWLLGASLIVRRPEPIRDVLTDVYRCLGLPIEPDTIGALASVAPEVRSVDVAAAVCRELSRLAAIVPGPWPFALDPSLVTPSRGVDDSGS